MSTKSNDYFKTFGDALKYALDYNRLSQSDFSELWGKDRAQVSKYANNISAPRPRSIQEIEELLKVRFLKDNDQWKVYTDIKAQKAIDSLDQVKASIVAYKASEPNRDEIPELLELIDELREEIDKMIR